jgi:hypothetical protein
MVTGRVQVEGKYYGKYYNNGSSNEEMSQSNEQYEVDGNVEDNL